MTDLISKNCSIGILGDRNTPTWDYWLQGILNSNSKHYAWLNPKEYPSELNKKLANLEKIIIIRYLPRIWIKSIYSLKASGVKIILFLDDDLLNIPVFYGLPFSYNLTLWWKIGRHKNRLYKLISELLVTNKYLAERCFLALDKNNIIVKVVPFIPPEKVIKQKSIYRICYFGTTSHELEIEWIRKLFIKIQKKRDDCILDIVVNNSWRKEFKKIPRVRMLHPMTWETFLLDTGNRRIDLFLVPLIRTPFNLARSPVKYLDAVRLKSVGIYSNERPYSEFVTNNVDGVLLPNNHDMWIECIEKLLSNKKDREKIVNSSISRASSIIRKIDNTYLE